MNDLLQLMHDTMGKTANIKGSVALLKKDGISQVDAEKLLDIIENQANALNEVIDAYYTKKKDPSSFKNMIKSVFCTIFTRCWKNLHRLWQLINKI